MDSKLMSDWPYIKSRENSDGSNIVMLVFGTDWNYG